MSDTGAKAKIKVKFKINVEYAFQIFLRLSHFMHICQTTSKYLIAVLVSSLFSFDAIHVL